MSDIKDKHAQDGKITRHTKRNILESMEICFSALDEIENNIRSFLLDANPGELELHRRLVMLGDVTRELRFQGTRLLSELDLYNEQIIK